MILDDDDDDDDDDFGGGVSAYMSMELPRIPQQELVIADTDRRLLCPAHGVLIQADRVDHDDDDDDDDADDDDVGGGVSAYMSKELPRIPQQELVIADTDRRLLRPAHGILIQPDRVNHVQDLRARARPANRNGVPLPSSNSQLVSMSSSRALLVCILLVVMHKSQSACSTLGYRIRES
jgi:hypothetical protein